MIEWNVGDWVAVRNPLEILGTLDGDGTLDGVPFMPEMLQFCGKRLRVLRRAEKTCVEISAGNYEIREFTNNNVLLLEGLRCSGNDHDGCQRGCLLFWKTAWLSKVGDYEPSPVPAPHELARLHDNLKTKVSPNRYFCQSSQLSKATQARHLRRMEILTKCWRDLRSGAVGAGELARLILGPMSRKIRDSILGRPRLTGNLTQTPVGDLNLQPGELVEIRSVEEIRKTLDARGRNRGLVCDIELSKFFGKKYRVLGRLDRMISEATGQMRNVEGTVILDGSSCMCARTVGGCPRQEYTYWREVWLRRIEPEHMPATQIAQVKARRRAAAGN